MLHTEIGLPGEIVLNADRIAHVTPRVGGVVDEVRKNVGDTVRAGEPLAVLEGVGIADAKVAYLSAKIDVSLAQDEVELAQAALKVAQSDRETIAADVEVAQSSVESAKSSLGVAENGVRIARTDLERRRIVRENTVLLLKDLAERASHDEIVASLENRPIGENRAKLLSAYSSVVAAETIFKRETSLHEKGISSEAERLAARTALETASSELAALREEIDYSSRLAVMEAEQSVAEKEQVVRDARKSARAAEQTLRTARQASNAAAQVVAEAEQRIVAANSTRNVAQSAHHVAEQRLHLLGLSNDDIATIRYEHEDNPELTRYVMCAPFAGTVVEKHIALGETLTEESDPYIIADLNSVWVNLTVYQKDLPLVRKGLRVVVSAGHAVPDAEGVISYVDESTRTALARIVLPNPDGHWRPGLFVTGQVAASSVDVPILVPKEAIQRVEDKPSVFVVAEDGDGFEPRHVELGRSNSRHVEIVGGLAAGERYVSKGAFTLKAELQKGAFSDGHAH